MNFLNEFPDVLYIFPEMMWLARCCDYLQGDAIFRLSNDEISPHSLAIPVADLSLPLCRGILDTIPVLLTYSSVRKSWIFFIVF